MKFSHVIKDAISNDNINHDGWGINMHGEKEKSTQCFGQKISTEETTWKT
jgi:hypothetical protein